MKIIWTPGSVYEPAGTWDFQGYTFVIPDNPYLPGFVVVALKRQDSIANVLRESVTGYMTAIIRKEVPNGELQIARQLGFTTVRNMIVKDNWQSIGTIG